MDILVQMIIGLAIGWRSLLAINAMTVETHHGIRLLHLVLATFAAWIALSPFFPEEWGDVPKLGALATYLILELVNRRRCPHEDRAVS
jgi:hypothetical protein